MVPSPTSRFPHISLLQERQLGQVNYNKKLLSLAPQLLRFLLLFWWSAQIFDNHSSVSASCSVYPPVPYSNAQLPFQMKQRSQLCGLKLQYTAVWVFLPLV